MKNSYSNKFVTKKPNKHQNTKLQNLVQKQRGEKVETNRSKGGGGKSIIASKVTLGIKR